MLIIIAAFFLNFVMVSIGLVKAVTDLVLSLGWPPLAMLLAIIAFYLILGCFMETLSMMIATTPVVVPVITAMGYSPIWWGIIFVILMEAALITPPVGLNLYVVQSVRKHGPFCDVLHRRPSLCRRNDHDDRHSNCIPRDRAVAAEPAATE